MRIFLFSKMARINVPAIDINSLIHGRTAIRLVNCHYTRIASIRWLSIEITNAS